MPPASRTPVSPSTFINDCLQDFNEAELKDVIRVAQRHLKAKVQQARADASAEGARNRWRFWDRPLELDWLAPGLPKVQFPRRGTEGKQVDWNVFELLRGAACRPMQVDWEVLELLSPKKAKHEDVNWKVFQLLGSPQACVEPEEEPASADFSAVDWSGDRLPHSKSRLPAMRRPGRPGRVRTGRHHRAIEPQPRKGSEAGADLAAILTAPQPIKKASLPRAPWASRRTTVRIHQPNGGGR